MSAAMSPLVATFVAHFGEMGSRWGINRTVGQIYALIFVSPQPLHADDIAEKLEFSRSNVSMGLKELQAWRLVKLKRLPGDRLFHCHILEHEDQGMMATLRVVG